MADADENYQYAPWEGAEEIDDGGRIQPTHEAYLNFSKGDGPSVLVPLKSAAVGRDFIKVLTRASADIGFCETMASIAALDHWKDIKVLLIQDFQEVFLLDLLKLNESAKQCWSKASKNAAARKCVQLFYVYTIYKARDPGNTFSMDKFVKEDYIGVWHASPTIKGKTMHHVNLEKLTLEAARSCGLLAPKKRKQAPGEELDSTRAAKRKCT